MAMGFAQRCFQWTAAVIAALATLPTALAQSSSDAATENSASTIEEVVVYGQRASLEKAAEIKKDADQVVDALVAEDIGKFPDVSTAAALQRVPGVQVTVGDNNEIVNPIIRGLGDILTTLNGREIFTGTGRGFAFQDLPAEALAEADVYKSSSADLIEGGVAGTINLKLHKAFDFDKPTFAFNGRVTREQNSGKYSPNVGFLAADRWQTGAGEIGALLDVSWQDTHFNRPIVFDCDQRSTNHGPPGAANAAAPTCVGGLNQYGKYQRPQANLSVQWQVSRTLQLYMDGLFAGYRSDWDTAFILDDLFSGQTLSNVKVDGNCGPYSVNGAGFYDPAGELETLCNTTSLSSNNFTGFTSTQAHHDYTNDGLLAFGAKFNEGRMHISTDLAYQKSHTKTRNFIVDVGQRNIPTINVVTNDNNSANFNTPNDPLRNPAGIGLAHSLFQDFEDHLGTEFAVRFDGRYELDTLVRNIQFGFRFADRTAIDRVTTGGPGAPGGDYNTLVSSLPLPSNFLVTVPGVPNIDGGAGWLVPNGDLLRDPAIQSELRTIYGSPTGDPAYNPVQGFNAAERTYSGYLQAAYKFAFSNGMSLDGLVGSRFTETQRSLLGTGLVTPAPTPGNPNPPPVLTPVNTDTGDSDFLPNLSARLKFSDQLQSRFSVARTIARPSFASLNPGLFYIVSANPEIHNAGNGGNPDLAPEKATAYDATLEYYFRHNGFVEVAVYRKDITNRIVNGVDAETINGIIYNISRPRNVGSATLQGVELSAQTYFDALPGALSGFGVFGNYTLAKSTINTAGDPLRGYELQGVSKNSFNAGLLYEKYRLSGRLAYTYRSRYYDEDRSGVGVSLHSPNGPIFLNYVRPNGRLDFALNYAVTSYVSVGIDGTNLTKAHYQSYYNLALNPRDNRYDDTSYAINVRLRY